MSAQTWNVVDAPAVPNGECGHTILLTFTGDFDSTALISEVLVFFNIEPFLSDFDMVGINWLGTNLTNPFVQNAELEIDPFDFKSFRVQYEDDFPAVEWGDIDSLQFVVEISGGDVGDCFNFERVGFAEMIVDGVSYSPLPATGNNIDVCNDSISVFGNVSAYTNIDCQSPPCTDISGVDLSVRDIETEQVKQTESSGLTGNYNVSFYSDGPYEVCVEETCETPCGITALDIVEIRRFLLGYKFLCWSNCFTADVNGDGEVSTLDLLVLQQHLLGLPPSSQTPTDWCRWTPISGVPLNNLVDLDDCDPDVLSSKCFPFATPPLEIFRFNVGDVNASCQDCDFNNLQEEEIALRSASQDEYAPYNIQKRTSPEEVRYYHQPEDEVYALSLLFETENMKSSIDIESSLPGLDYAYSDDGLRVLWYAEEGFSSVDYLKGGEPLLTITGVEAKKLEMIQSGENLLLAQDDIYSLYNSSTSVDTEIRPIFEIHGNQVRILEATGIVSIDVYNISGQKLRSLSRVGRYDLSPLPRGMYVLHARDGMEIQVEKVYIH